MRCKKTILILLVLLGLTLPLSSQQHTESTSILPPKIEGKIQYRRIYHYGQWIYEYQYKGAVKNLQPIEYENASNSQKVIKRTDSVIYMRNTANLLPFSSTIPFPVGTRYHAYAKMPKEYRPDVSSEKWGNPYYANTSTNNPVNKYLRMDNISQADQEYIKKIADSVVAGTTLQSEAVEKVMEYMRANVNYSLGVSTNPADVLRNGFAFCMGYASAAVYLLRTQGIPARYVVCYIPRGFGWGFSGSGGYHEFLEVYYDDIGWVSYDPQHSVHFVDPYHIVLGYPEEGFYEDRSIISYLVQGGSWKNSVTIANDPRIYNVSYYPYYVRLRADIFEKLPTVPVLVTLESFSREARYELEEVKKEQKIQKTPNIPGLYYIQQADPEREIRNDSARDMYEGSFYVAVKHDKATQYRLKAKGNGASYTLPLDIPANAREIKINPKDFTMAFRLTGKEIPQNGAAVSITRNFNKRKSELQFDKLGITDSNGMLIADTIEDGDAIVQAYIESTPRLFAAKLKKGTIVECAYPLDDDVHAKNFLQINKLLGTPVSLTGKISLPDNKLPVNGSLWLVKSNGQQYFLNIDNKGMFHYESDRKDDIPVRIEFSNGQCFGSMALEKIKDRIEGYIDFDFAGKAMKAEVRSPEAYMYSITDDGYVYTLLRPGQDKYLYLLSDMKEIFLGSSPNAIDVTRVVPGSSDKIVVGAGGTPEEMAARYELFARSVNRKNGWSAFGYLRNADGAFERTYETYLQRGTHFSTFDIHNSGAFVLYGKTYAGGTRIVLRKNGYYYKSGNIEMGHLSVKADFSKGEYITVLRKAGSTRGGVYVHTADGTTGVAAYDVSGTVRIRVEGEFTLSPDGNATNAISVAGKERGGSVEM